MSTPTRGSSSRTSRPRTGRWHPSREQYYWHRFFAHQPDLNFDNPEVREAMFKEVDRWFAMGVDGMRLDAVPYLFERDGTNGENLPETHDFLKQLRAHVDANFDDRMLLAEANQWPEDAVDYFGDGDECHMNFHFPLMPRLFMALRMEDRHPTIDILEQTPDDPRRLPVGDVPAQPRRADPRDGDRRGARLHVPRRTPTTRACASTSASGGGLAPLLQNDRRRIELMYALLFALPGTPVVYYGEELGMGDNVYLGDRDAVRTPMQWIGRPQRRVLARPTRRACTYRRSSTPSTTSSRPTSRPSSRTRRRCCGGCAA
ncbi:MAG: alpha-amylase family glycosyl hydrolase [Acidimicrobiia bacterium]|nr:alpha-amylase family glycosyl hydrolase [Acidimicrobiia bacterium]